MRPCAQIIAGFTKLEYGRCALCSRHFPTLIYGNVCLPPCYFPPPCTAMCTSLLCIQDFNFLEDAIRCVDGGRRELARR